jgi:predicted ribosomally synthesized peptide with SipW-like signal peptide
MQSTRNAVFGCVLAAGVPSAFAYFNASDHASSVQAHAWAKFAAPLATKLK